jgi:hypothetical protein
MVDIRETFNDFPVFRLCHPVHGRVVIPADGMHRGQGMKEITQ